MISKDHRISGIGKDHGISGIGKDHRISGIGKDHRISGISKDHRISGIGKDHRISGIGKDHGISGISKDHGISGIGKDHGISQIRGCRTARGFTLVELLIVIAIIAVLAALAIPGLLRARISSNEASAIASLRAISTAQATFSRSCADGEYARQLDVLGVAPSGQQAFLGPDLAASATMTKSGYVFSIDGTAGTGTACNGATALAIGYHAWADPISANQGIRFFGSNTTNTVWQSTTTLSALSDTGAPANGTPIQ